MIESDTKNNNIDKNEVKQSSITIKEQLKEKRQQLHKLGQRLSNYQTKHMTLLEKEEEMEKKAIENEELKRKEREEKDRLEKERKALLEELQKQAMSTPTISQPQKITFPTTNNYFGAISEQDAIAWLRQQ
ncbi:unnamed protein product [Cunninghamella echinulata]